MRDPSAVGERRRAAADEDAASPTREVRFRDVVDAAAAVLRVTETSGACSFLSRAWYELTGQDERDALGHGWLKAVHVADRAAVARAIERAVADRAPVSLEYRVRLAGGDHRWVLDSSRPRFDASGAFAGLVSSSIDVHDHKLDEAELRRREGVLRANEERVRITPDPAQLAAEVGEAVRRSEEQLRLVTDALPVRVSMVDPDYRFLFVNAAYERWLGLPREKIVGRAIVDLIGSAAFDTARPHMERALAGHVVRYEAEIPFRQGTRYVEATYLPQRSDDGRVSGFVALVSDVSERKTFEAFRSRAAARTEQLLTITTAIAGAITSSDVYTALVDHVSAALGASKALLVLTGEDGRHAHLVRAFGYPEWKLTPFASISLDLEPSVPMVDAMRRRELVWFTTEELHARYPHLSGYASDGPQLAACLPLLAGDHVLGVLSVVFEGDDRPDPDTEGFLLLVAGYASQAVERLRLDREMLAARTRAEHLYRFARAVVEAERVERVYEAALVALESALGANTASIRIEERDGVRVRAAHGLAPEHVARIETLGLATATSLEPVVVADTRDPAGGEHAAEAVLRGVRSLLLVPIAAEHSPIGEVAVEWTEPRALGPAELEIAQAIADHLGSVVRRFAAVAKLEETIRDNDLFAGVLAHDLRNPLNAMMTAAQLVLLRRAADPATDVRDQKPLGRIVRSGRRMTEMIDQLLDLTRARSGGGIAIRPHETDLAALCKDAVAELELAHPEWNIALGAAGDERGTWDSSRLMQVVSNLVSNAGQHGTRGAPIRIAIDGTERDHVVMEVRNEGAIPTKLLPHLFDPFRRGGHRRGSAGGLGLGLFIVREIVRAHGGTVHVRSDESDGTTFAVRLPRHVARRAHDV
jgi:PAS domain S-box-containing protein